MTEKEEGYQQAVDRLKIQIEIMEKDLAREMEMGRGHSPTLMAHGGLRALDEIRRNFNIKREPAVLKEEAEENERRDKVNLERVKDIPESTMKAVFQRAKELREKHRKEEK